jgi:hypothetical protein
MSQIEPFHFIPWATPAATAEIIEVRLLADELSLRPDIDVPAAHWFVPDGPL